MTRILIILAAIIYVSIGTIIGRWVYNPKKHDLLDYVLVNITGFIILTSLTGFILLIIWMNTEF